MRGLYPLLIALVGCSAQLELPADPSVSTRPARTVVATAEPSPGTTEPCRSNDEVVAALDRFVDAVNSGDTGAIRATISRYAEFLWVGSPSHDEVVFGQDALVHHLFERHRAGDRFASPRLELRSLVGWDGSAHFEITAIQLTREGKTVTLRGKGALQCRGRGEGIVVLSLAEKRP